MGLRTALVDRARIVRKEAAAPRVLGTTPVAPTHQPWFRCRIEIPQGSEDTAEQNIAAGRRSAMKRPNLMYDWVDEDGQPVTVSFTDMLEVDSPELGRALWRVTNTPSAIRKKRRVIGWETQLQRIVERELLSELPITEQEA